MRGIPACGEPLGQDWFPTLCVYLSHVRLCGSYALVDVVGSGTGFGYTMRKLSVLLSVAGEASRALTAGASFLLVGASIPSKAIRLMTLFLHDSQGP